MCCRSECVGLGCTLVGIFSSAVRFQLQLTAELVLAVLKERAGILQRLQHGQCLRPASEEHGRSGHAGAQDGARPCAAGTGSPVSWARSVTQSQAATRDLARLDSDGIGLVVFNCQGVESFAGVDASKLAEVFAARGPRSSTPLAEELTAAIKLAGKSDKKDFVIVFTDAYPMTVRLPPR